MDSHFFRQLAAAPETQVTGRRIQKVYAPAPGVVTLDLGKPAGGEGRFLLLRYGNKEPLLFLAPEKPKNPETPSASAMWLRKRLMGRRLREQHCDWPGRRLAWELSGRPRNMNDEEDSAAGPEFLMLCLRNGLSLVSELPQGFGREPEWPPFEQAYQALRNHESPENEEFWRKASVLTPALRKTMAALEETAARELYIQLQSAEITSFYVYILEQHGQSAAEALAWRLPEVLRQKRDERCFQNATDAAVHAGSVTLFSQLARDEDSAERTARKKAHKRLKRALAKVAQEETRLQGLCGLRRKGQLLQAALWQLSPERKLHHVDVPDYEAPDGQMQQGQPPLVRVDLDPSLTIAANMERFFRLAAKGERGLPITAARRQALQAELDQLRQGRLPQRDALRQQFQEAGAKQKSEDKSLAQKYKNIAVSRFRTSDGFLVLRGRNKAANHKLLTQIATPYDLWFHAQDGPGAHLVLKRDHPRQEPPRASMLEAAALAGLKGWQAGDAKARVICALVKDVRSIKGAELGRVAVDKVLEAFQVPLDSELEARLRLE